MNFTLNIIEFNRLNNKNLICLGPNTLIFMSFKNYYHAKFWSSDACIRHFQIYEKKNYSYFLNGFKWKVYVTN